MSRSPRGRAEPETGATLLQCGHPRTDFGRGCTRTRLGLPEGRCELVAELDDGCRATLELEVDPLATPRSTVELIVK